MADDRKASLTITRMFSGSTSDFVRVTIKAGSAIMAQTEMSLESYATASLGTSEVPVTLTKPAEGERVARVDAAFAARLRESMERNARMVNRLKDLVANDSTPTHILAALEFILADR